MSMGVQVTGWSWCDERGGSAAGIRMSGRLGWMGVVRTEEPRGTACSDDEPVFIVVVGSSGGESGRRFIFLFVWWLVCVGLRLRWCKQ